MRVKKFNGRPTILVTGGAGYIGSHVVKALGEQGEAIVTLDNLSTGFADAVLYGDLVIGDIGDKQILNDIFSQYNIDAVMHFAALTSVEESVRDPLKYFNNNLMKSLILFEASIAANIDKIVFSSSASVYGNPNQDQVDEKQPTDPLNPYGISKRACESLLQEFSRAYNCRSISLRYFNVAGADPEGKLGQSTHNATTLIKVIAEYVTNKRDSLTVFGTDYPTKDGSGIRDYIHVSDIAKAHLCALNYLRNGGTTEIVNIGYGHGFSVLEVIKAAEKATSQTIQFDVAPRRLGDPIAVVAAADKARHMLNWQPEYDNLDFIVKTALDWEKRSCT